MEQISSPFLSLPTELQAGILSFVWKYSDLRSLCLVSKHVSCIATPILYYEVSLTDESRMKENISSLLINPANLHFVQVLKTERMMTEESKLMDQILPRLQKDFLKEFTFFSFDTNNFPMPHQMEFLWYNQKNLQDLTLTTHLVGWLKKFSEEPKPGRRAILEFFNHLEITNFYNEDHLQCMQSNMLWPLKNLDMTVLQKLTITASVVDCSILSTLNYLIAAGYFVNLGELQLRNIKNLDQTLFLTRMPSLRLLGVYQCNCQGPSLPLVLAHDIRLSYLFYSNTIGVEKITSLLTQARDLEYLSLQCNYLKDTSTAKTQRDLISAIMRINTLRELYLFHKCVALDSNLEATLWDSFRSYTRTE